MDQGTALVGLIIILLCAIPFVLMGLASRNKKKKILNGLMETAVRNHCNISRFELKNNFAIGIDDEAAMAFFKRNSKDSDVSQEVNLSEVQRCRVYNSTRTTGSKGAANVVDRLELLFAFQDKTKGDASFEIFNTNHGSLTLTGELQLAEKWAKIFNEKIAEKAKQK